MYAGDLQISRDRVQLERARSRHRDRIVDRYVIVSGGMRRADVYAAWRLAHIDAHGTQIAATAAGSLQGLNGHVIGRPRGDNNIARDIIDRDRSVPHQPELA